MSEVESGRRRARRRAIAVIVGIGVVALGVWVAPRASTLPSAEGGGEELAGEVRPMLQEAGAMRAASVVTIDDDGLESAHFGASDDTEYEIGSISKTFTAALFADAVERGEVAADDAVSDHLDLDGSAIGDVRLEELAAHTSGLPSVPGGFGQLMRNYGSLLFGSDPYPFDLGDLLDHARSESLAGRGTYAYSNMGLSLLGQAVAAAADGRPPADTQRAQSYATLVSDRIFAPLGMTATTVPSSAGELGDDAPTGLTGGGRHSDAWTLGAYAPSGSIRSTPADMAIWMSALLNGSAPGSTALEPRTRVDDALQLGYAWHVTDTDWADVTWHNGRTGGFGSMLALDRDDGRGAMVLVDSAVDVDQIGFTLLERPAS
jgi:CubicO group peptidase (beta-lactamase class C family)